MTDAVGLPDSRTALVETPCYASGRARHHGQHLTEGLKLF